MIDVAGRPPLLKVSGLSHPIENAPTEQRQST